MRAPTNSACVYGNLPSSAPLEGPQRASRGRLFAWILGAFAVLCLGSVPAKADLPPETVATVSTAAEVAKLFLSVESAEDDPVLREEMRQLLLWLYWKLGGNPWELDPNWVPPIGGQP